MLLILGWTKAEIVTKITVSPTQKSFVSASDIRRVNVPSWAQKLNFLQSGGGSVIPYFMTSQFGGGFDENRYRKHACFPAAFFLPPESGRDEGAGRRS